MHPDETPRQHEARQPDDFEPPPHTMPPRLGAGECGDAIWECSAQPGGVIDAREPADNAGALQPGGHDEAIRGGRFIDLVERRRTKGH